MPNWTFLTLHFFHTLALCLWVGGIVAVGVLTAPAVFGCADDRALAGRIMQRVLRRFDAVVLACIATLATTSVLFVRWYGRLSPWYAIEYVCIGLMSASALYSATVISPRLQRLRDRGESGSEEWDRLHRTSVLAMQFNLACGTVAIFFS